MRRAPVPEMACTAATRPSASGVDASPYANSSDFSTKSGTPAMPAYSWFIMLSSTTFSALRTDGSTCGLLLSSR